MKTTWAAVLLAATLGTGCTTGTFVTLDFTDPQNSLSGVSSIAVALTLDNKAASATFSASGKAFPISGTLQIDSGTGDLVVTASAVDAAGKVLATAMGDVTVSSGKTVHLALAFSAENSMGDLSSTGALTISPMSFDFGPIVVSEMSAPEVFTITNTGSNATGTLSATVAGVDAADYTLSSASHCVGRTLASGSSCTIVVRFVPMTVGLVKSASVRVSDSSSGASASLVGRAGPRGSLNWNENAHVFADTLTGQLSPDVTFTLTNTGSVPSSTIAVALGGANAGDFEETPGSDTCTGQTLAGGASCTVSVHAKPTTRGFLVATLSADASTGGLTTVALTGRGIIPASLTFSGVATMAAPFDLGTVDIGTAGTTHHMFTIRNDGDTPAGAITFVGSPDLSQLQKSSGPSACLDAGNATPTILAPGDSCTVDAVLLPTSFGTKNISVTMSAMPGGSGVTYVTGIGRDTVTIIVGAASGQSADGTITDSAIPHNFACGGPSNGLACSATFTRTTSPISVAFVAQPDAANYWLFDHWTMPTSPACGAGTGNSTCTLTLDSSVAAGSYMVLASYKKQQFALTYARKDYGTGLGSLSATNASISCSGPCTSANALQIDGGTQVTIDASQSGSSLRRISGACTARSATASDASCSFTMTADKDVQVVYSAYNYAFVSSMGFDGALGGIGSNVPPAAATGAAAKCQALADAANLPGVFVAVLSDGTNDAIGQIPASTGGWIRTDGAPFAQNRGTLFGSSAPNYGVYYPLRVDETGALLGSINVRTFSNANGTHKTSGDHCTNWTSNSAASATTPFATTTGGAVGWIDTGGIGGTFCSSAMRLYCFGTTQTADVPAPAAPPSAKLVFVSTGLFTPATGKSRADLDTLCNTEGAAAFAGKTFKSIAATTTSAMSDQSTATTSTFMRPDKVVVGTYAQLFGSTPSPQAAIDVFANGSYYQPGALAWAWTGANNPTVLASATSDCTDWSSTASTTAKAGDIIESSSSLYANSGTNFNCGNAYHAYCVEQ